MKNFLIKHYKVLILIISMAYVISGQTGTGVINGIVLDQFGAVVSGVNVTLTLKEGTKTEGVRKITTDSEGKYSFSNVLPGEYEITVKANWIDRNFRKSAKITSAKPVQTNLTISFEPCSDEEELVNQIKLTDTDRAEIVRELIKLILGKPEYITNQNTDKIILSNANINPTWLPADQKPRITVMTRLQIQDRTEKTGELQYFTVSKMTQRGRCVAVSMLDNLTVKGQLEDANMAGGGTVYEFRKVDGRWIGTVLTAWIS